MNRRRVSTLAGQSLGPLAADILTHRSDRRDQSGGSGSSGGPEHGLLEVASFMPRSRSVRKSAKKAKLRDETPGSRKPPLVRHARPPARRVLGVERQASGDGSD